MTRIEQFLKQASGNWLTAGHCEAGDRLKIITKSEIDDKTFDKPYLVCGVISMRTGEEYNLRLGIKNVRRIQETLGIEENAWVSRFLEVVSIEEYPGFGKGLLLRGLPREPIQTQMDRLSQRQGEVTAEAVNTINDHQALITLGYPLNRSDWNKLPTTVRVNLTQNRLVQEKEDLIFFTDAAKKFLEVS